VPRDDKLVDPADAKVLLQRRTAVEEKVDGANCGLSIGSTGRICAQSRGHYLDPGTGGQWKALWGWLASRESQLTATLGSSLILFGEWCYAQHSVAYDALPDWMLVTDVYDRQANRFWSRLRRDALARRLGLAMVPLLAEGTFSATSLLALIGPSRLGAGWAEGIYLRWDDGDWLLARAKVVRPGWTLADEEHWSARPLRENHLMGATSSAARSRGPE